MMDKPKKLNKYCTIPVMLDMLIRRRIKLLDPKNWKDKNDIHNLAVYQKHFGYKKILATCFLASGETIHHWGQYADGTLGCCIEFDKNILIDVENNRRMRYGMVEYVPINKVCEKTPRDLPFIKRLAYYVEDEFRIIYQGDEDEVIIPFKHEQIVKITLNSGLSKDILKTMKGIIKSMVNCKVNVSTLENSNLWKKQINLVVSSQSQ